MGVKMIAAAAQRYEGKVLRSGDKFEVKDEVDADDLVTLRFATRDLSAEDDPVAEEGTTGYHRRDIQTEQSSNRVPRVTRNSSRRSGSARSDNKSEEE